MILGVLLTFVFVTIEIVLTSALEELADVSDRAGAILAGFATALTLTPMLQRVENRLDKLVERVLPNLISAEVDRYEACVLFFDIKEFSALSVMDHSAAQLMVNILHREARKVASEHGGRVVRTAGDKVLLEFETVTSAVRAARQILARVRRACLALELPEMAYQAGMDQGEVIRLAGGDLFGNTVSRADFLETCATADQLVTPVSMRQHMPEETMQSPGSFRHPRTGLR